jgi:UDP-N-acetylmuramoyl-L-alanyl-D-glutamate--2,6-diaminopimelate ligase
MDAMTGIAGLASDSREVREGYLFAALPGLRANGASFIADAVKRGAVAVLGAPQAAGEARSLGVRFIADENPRARLARIAAAFFGAQPGTVAAVTGTNGKTSVTVFLRQLWALAGHRAASMGTIGIVTPDGEIPLAHTTPDPIETHRVLAQLAHAGVDHLALEASSHGLDQHRLDGVEIAAAAFTNLTRDHLDYHPDFDHYRAAKLRLFSQLLRDGGTAVVNADASDATMFERAARARGLRIMSIGRAGETLRLAERRPTVDGQALELVYDAKTHHVALPLVGEFQAANALVAAALAIALGDSADDSIAALERLQGVPGRLERVARAACGAPIYVDYAHTPDALETVLRALRPHVPGRLHLVFGCGGDRDRGKRALMGEAAARLADCVTVTDDNPRSETASEIRRAILAVCPGAREIGERGEAIRAAIAQLQEGDSLIIAGKGHETGQIVGAEIRPFSDRDEAIAAARAQGGTA